MNARDNAWVVQSSVGVTGSPLAEIQFHAIELTTDITHQTRWSEVKNSKASVEQLFFVSDSFSLKGTMKYPH